MWTSVLLLHWELPLGTSSVGFIYFSSQLCCPLRFQNFSQTRWWEGFLVFENFSSFKTPFLGWNSIPNSFVPLFIFYIFSYLLSKTTGCFSGCLMSFASVQKLFCGICSAFKCSFNEFVGKKVISPSYSFAILGPPPYKLLLFSCSVMSDSLQLHGLQHARLLWPSSPRVCSNSYPLSHWCHPTISSSAIPFFSCLQAFSASGSFQWVSSSYQVVELLELQLQHQSLWWILRVDSL